MNTPPGWFGKVPALGDFVTRRLPVGFLQPWDHWITRGVSDTQRDHGDAGREGLLTFPVWRFLLPPHLLNRQGWFGLLAPSVDRVGRRFPLTIAAELSESQYATLSIATIATTLEPWLEALMRVLEDDDVATFDAALQIPYELAGATLSGLANIAPSIEFTRPLVTELTMLGEQQLRHTLGGRSLWWTEPSGIKSSGIESSGIESSGIKPSGSDPIQPGIMIAHDGALSAVLFEQLVRAAATELATTQPVYFGHD